MKALLPLVVLLVACAPDIPQNPPPPSAVVVQFDPGATVPVVPVPNDLAIVGGKVVVPKGPNDSAAQTEFNEQYLGTLNGFPYESTASVLLTGALNPSTVNPTSVVGIDVTAAKANPQAPPVALAPVYDAAHSAIVVPPPGGSWTRGHQYAIALVAGPDGVQGAKGEPVVGSPTWELVSSPKPLVDCPNGDMSSGACTLTVDIIPSTMTDPAARIADQLAKAKQLEQIRAGYAPLLAQLEASLRVSRAQIPILWTFTIVDAGELTFDPANGVIPFPNDVLLSGSKVTLPNPKTGMPLAAADCAMPTDPTIALYCGLNTLDGFSTIAPPISENSPTAGAAAQAQIDGNTLVAGMTVGLSPIASKAPMAEQTTPSFTPCLNCLSSMPAAGMPTPPGPPQQLQWKLDVPLDEQTTYLAWVTGDVRDSQGKGVVANPVFALTRLANPLVDGAGHATVNILTDDQAAKLEPLRKAMQPAIDGLAAKGVPRTNLALAWAFTTQSEATVLDKLNGYPPQVPISLLPDTPLYVFDATAQYQAIATASGVKDFTNVGKVLVGVFLTPVAVTGPGGTLDPFHPKILPVNFTLALPKTPPPSTGYPLTIFGHGITRSRQDYLFLAGALASSALGPLAQATIATDLLYHGERTSCTGAAAAIMGATSDDAACADPVNQMCNEQAIHGRCVARDPTKVLPCRPGTADDYAVCAVAGQGACVGRMGMPGSCEGGDFLRDNYKTLSMSPTTVPLIPFQRPVISGWNMFSLSNFFSTRDNFRQQVIDLAQLVRILKSTATTNLTAQATAAAMGPVSFDMKHLGYVGQSLGSILGTLFSAVSPDLTNVALNVGGGDLPQIILNAPSFAPYKKALLDTLAMQNPPVLPGTPQFDQFIATAQWVLDPADPANMAWRVTHPVTPNANRKAFIQFIEGDQTVPNISNFALLTGADRPFMSAPPSFGCKAPLSCYEFTEQGDGFDATSVPGPYRHQFMLVPPAMDPTMPSSQALMLTTKAQTQVVTFLATGSLP